MSCSSPRIDASNSDLIERDSVVRALAPGGNVPLRRSAFPDFLFLSDRE